MNKQSTNRHNAKRGRAGGLASLAKGVGACGRSQQQMTADGKKGGSRGGPAIKALGVGIFAPGNQSTGGKISMHRRWHVARAKPNPRCELCVKEIESQMRLIEVQHELQDK